MKVSSSAWKSYVDRLSKIDHTAAEKVASWYRNHPDADINELVNITYYYCDHYGNAAAELACEMYEEMADASGKVIKAAEPAMTSTRGEIYSAIQGALLRTQNPDAIGAIAGRKVKTVGLDTLINNSLRDGAEFAWIPSGDTCAFCIMLASNGWQRASKKALKNGHASHIHNNCDCTYAIRFDENTEVEGYDPDYYKSIYDNAEGRDWRSKVNSMRRDHYAANKDKINAQKRVAYAKMKAAEKPKQLLLEAESPFKNPSTPLSIDSVSQSKHIVGGKMYNDYLKTHPYPPSFLTITEEEAQKLVEKYHGTGILKLDRNGRVLPSEIIVDNDIVIGFAVNNMNGKMVETTGFKIHYSNKGTHIVPTYESQKQYWIERRRKNGHDWLLRQKG